MTEYQIVKLPSEGDELTMFVENVFFNPKSEKHKYPDFTFSGRSEQGHVKLYVPENACRRQFGRKPNNMEPEACQNMTVRFWRGQNKEDSTKPYWNIEVLSAHDSTAPAPSRRLSAPPPPSTVPGEAPAANQGVRAATGQQTPKAGPVSGALVSGHATAPTRKATRDDVSAAYRWALGQSRGAQGEDAGPEAYQAGAATILIALDKQGLIPGFANATLGDVKKVLDLGDPSDDTSPLPF